MENPQPGHGRAGQSDDIVLRRPTLDDGAAIHALIASAPPLDLNSTYAYLLLCHHFRDTCVVAEQDGKVLGFISAYLPPTQPETFFVWQVAVHAQARGRGLGVSMLRYLLQRVSGQIQYLETTVSPSNQASRAMFARLAKDCETVLSEQAMFPKALFGAGAGHEDEMLLRIGPFH